MIHMWIEILTPPFQGCFIHKTNIATRITIILHFFFNISLLCKFIDDDSSDDICQENVEECFINNIRNKSTIIILFILPTHTFTNDLLSVERAYTSKNWVTVLVNSIYIDINILVFVEGADIVIDSEKTKDQRKSQSKKANKYELLPCELNCFENTLEKLYFSKYKEQCKGIYSQFEETGIKRD